MYTRTPESANKSAAGGSDAKEEKPSALADAKPPGPAGSPQRRESTARAELSLLADLVGDDKNSGDAFRLALFDGPFAASETGASLSLQLVS